MYLQWALVAVQLSSAAACNIWNHLGYFSYKSYVRVKKKHLKKNFRSKTILNIVWKWHHYDISFNSKYEKKIINTLIQEKKH
jgi:hypothetical protein